MRIRSQGVQHSIYRALLLLYPRSFRREYGGLMAQAFSDRVRERGGLRTWFVVVGDLSLSVPQQILEVSLMSQKWMPAALAAVGTALILASMIVGAGTPFFVVFIGIGLFVGLLSLLSLWADKRSGRATEFSYGGAAPKSWKWWTVLAVLLAVTYVLAAAGQLISDPKGTNVGALAIATGFAGLVVAGLRLRSRSRIAGNWMIAMAAVPSLAFFWIILPAVLGLAVIIGAVSEIRPAPQGPLAT
jgi:hypothetical protein